MDENSDDLFLDLHCVVPGTLANGPGKRIGIWFQGCARKCPGCSNPQMQSRVAPIHKSVSMVTEEILDILSADLELEGVSLSGGEPFRQAEGLLQLLIGLRAVSELSVLVFTGFFREEISIIPLGDEILKYIDVLITGPYKADLHIGRGLRGSSNQKIFCLSDRYCMAEVEATPDMELWIGTDGSLRVSGVAEGSFNLL